MVRTRSLSFELSPQFFCFDRGSCFFLSLVFLTFMFCQFSDPGCFLTSSLFTPQSDLFSLTLLSFALESFLLFPPESLRLFLSFVLLSCKSFLLLMLDTEAFQSFFLFSLQPLAFLLLGFQLSQLSCSFCLQAQPLLFSTSVFFFDTFDLCLFSS